MCNLCKLTFILPGWIFKIQHMVYEECIILTRKDKIMKYMALCGYKTETMQQVLKMQSISSLPKYIKQISSGVFLHTFTYVNTGLNGLTKMPCLKISTSLWIEFIQNISLLWYEAVYFDVLQRVNFVKNINILELFLILAEQTTKK